MNEYGTFTKRIGYTSIIELICICLFPLILQCLRSIISIHFNISSKNRFYYSLIIDYFIILLPILLLLTILSSYIIIIVISCFIIFLLWLLIPPNDDDHQMKSSFEKFHTLPINIIIAYLRSTIYILSCIMIYAIDLPICPRRFAKSDINDLGLMDVGTGLFIYASGISGSKVVWYMNLDRDHRKSVFHCILNTVIPCLLLGLLRTLFIQLSNYHQSITEYGIHWNFFYTVALIRAISLIMTTDNFISSYLITFSLKKQIQFYYIISGIFLIVSELLPIIICPKYFQTRWQFNPRTLHYINDNRSKSLWIANFEGIISLFGYASIYFFILSSSLLVRSYLSRDTNKDNSNGKSSLNKKEFSLFSIYFICSFMILCLLGCFYLLGGSQMTSRRFANSNYILLIIFLSIICFLFLILMISLLIHFKSLFNLNLSYPPLSLIINDKGFLYFIISNLLTGFFNVFCLNTLQLLPEGARLNVIMGTYDDLSWSSSLLQFSVLLAYSSLSVIFVLIGAYYDRLKLSSPSMFGISK
ncbi:unnamed protein product [Schistosoma rodhaini]|uniref:Phosphatidylinositol-glycan biosynthesis class W protein n=1 Tax=Schistosoma rodhaini TaxID=6188 RepID=A0AA85GFW9_9TREM|nr:unnamed protein product [Schistosoma rodhaini]CAH8583987.1 unnamed protein product [Schistosoma rodhaini]